MPTLVQYCYYQRIALPSTDHHNILVKLFPNNDSSVCVTYKVCVRMLTLLWRPFPKIIRKNYQILSKTIWCQV